MKIKLITGVSKSDNAGLAQLKRSCEVNGLDLTVLVNSEIQWNWAGLPDIYNWCKTDEAREYTHILYSDGFDTFAQLGMQNIEVCYKETDKMLFSTEKHCFPRKDWEDKHPKPAPSEWQYLNHGQFIAPIDVFLRLYEGVFTKDITCQEYAMELFLNGSQDIVLDYECRIFQTIAFESDEDFKYGSFIQNLKTNSIPCFLHGNGKTDMSKVYKLFT